MNIAELQQIYGKHPNAEGLASLMNNPRSVPFFLKAYMLRALRCLLPCRKIGRPVHLFILNDLEEAGYFYHDLVQVDGDEHILFSLRPIVGPSSMVRKMRRMKFCVRRC